MSESSSRSACLAIALGASLLSGCTWLQNRANDALDVFALDFGQGPGLYADVRATDFVAVGVGMHDTVTWGMHGRYAGTSGRGAVAVGPLMWGWRPDGPAVSPMQSGDPSRFNQDVVDPPPSHLILWPAGPLRHAFPEYNETARGLRFADVSATLTIGYVGMHVGFSPGELVDFVLGVFGIDLSDDDAFGRPLPPESSVRSQ